MAKARGIDRNWGTDQARRQILELLHAQRSCDTGSALTYVSVPESPPDASVHWLPDARFVLPVEAGLHVRWPAGERVREECFDAGTALFLPARSWVEVRRDQPLRSVGIVLNPRHVRYLVVESNLPPSVWYHTHRSAPSIVLDLLSLARSAESPDQAHLVRSAIYLLTEHLGNDSSARISRSEALYESICQYINQHFSAPLDRVTLGTVFDRHPSHISDVFKQHGTCSLHEYLTDVRISRARQMLAETNLPIKVIVTSCGFSTLSHFGAVFRARTGTSPATYRTAVRQKPTA